MSGITQSPSDSQTPMSQGETTTTQEKQKNDEHNNNSTTVLKKRSATEAIEKNVKETIRTDSNTTASTTTSTGNSIKRHRVTDDESSKGMSKNVFDGAYTYGIKAGDRVSVKWEIIENEGTADEQAVDHWWGATLLEYDGRTYIEEEEDDDEDDANDDNAKDERRQQPKQAENDDNNDTGPVAVHVLEYDAYPEGGFPEKSHEEVIFASAFELVDMKSMDTLPYKRIGDDKLIEVIGDENGGFEEMVNTVLANAMEKSIGNFNSLPASVQLTIAEKIAEKKTKLVTLMEEFFASSGKRVGTPDDMKKLIQQTMQD